jgi:chromosome segregation ATPase
MSDIFKKLNVLIRASLNDLTSLEQGDGETPPFRLGKNIDRDIAALHDRLRDAETYELQLKTRVQALNGEIATLDLQADEAVTQGRNESARHAVEQMKRAQQRLTMTQGDLREHQLVTQELAQRVRELEYVVEEARKNTPPQQTSSASPLQALNDALQNLRKKGSDVAASSRLEEETPPPTAEVEEDLERRRQRLSK